MIKHSLAILLPLTLSGLLGGCRARTSLPPNGNGDLSPGPVVAPANPAPGNPAPGKTAGTASGTASPVDSAPGSLLVTLNPDKTSYRRGEIIQFSITLRNTVAKPARLSFASGQNFDITATPLGQKEPLWMWSTGKMFTQVFRTVELRPRKDMTWTATWEQTDLNGNAVPRGRYTLQAKIMANNGLLSAPVTLNLVD